MKINKNKFKKLKKIIQKKLLIFLNEISSFFILNKFSGLILFFLKNYYIINKLLFLYKLLLL